MHGPEQGGGPAPDAGALGANSAGHDLSSPALESYLDGLGLGHGRVVATAIGDGHSNLTFLIERPGGRWVLRAPPPGPLPPSAHDVLREYRILSACHAQVRVPAPVAACADPAVIGTPFYLMSYVDGAVMTGSLADGLDPLGDPVRIADELVRALGEIHAFDWRRSELAVLTSGRTPYLDRQLRRFSALRERNVTRELPAIDRVTSWLRRHQPPPRAETLVHGDFRLGNTLFSTQTPARLLAVLDWELAAIGDPLADLGYLTATWAVPGDDSDPLVRLGTVTAGAGFPGREELVERYRQVTGAPVGNLVWYQVLALWKSAIFLEGSYARHLKGAADDPFFSSLETGVPELAERAWSLTAGSRAA